MFLFFYFVSSILSLFISVEATQLRRKAEVSSDHKFMISHKLESQEWMPIDNLDQLEDILEDMSNNITSIYQVNIQPLKEIRSIVQLPYSNDDKCQSICENLNAESLDLPKYHWLLFTVRNKDHPVCSLPGFSCTDSKSLSPERCVCSKYITSESLDCSPPYGILFESLQECEDAITTSIGACKTYEDLGQIACFKSTKNTIRLNEWDIFVRKKCGSIRCINTDNSKIFLCGYQDEFSYGVFLCDEEGKEILYKPQFTINKENYVILNKKIYNKTDIDRSYSSVVTKFQNKGYEFIYKLDLQGIHPIKDSIEHGQKLASKLRIFIYTASFFGFYLILLALVRWGLHAFLKTNILLTKYSIFGSIIANLLFSWAGALKVTETISTQYFIILVILSSIILVAAAITHFVDEEDNKSKPAKKAKGLID